MFIIDKILAKEIQSESVRCAEVTQLVKGVDNKIRIQDLENCEKPADEKKGKQ